jgi:ABC-type branched-subunit amino acid transport system substrate-binding protein
MKAKSKWLAIFLVLGLTLAACGGDSGGDEDTTTTAGSTETTEQMTSTTEAMTSTTGGEMAEPTVDVGVDLDAGTITIGMLSDLTGPFGPLVSAIVAGHEAYWANVNANGGIHGLTVELNTVDTTYDIPTHVQFYEELKDEVVAFGHSTGSPHTVAINPQLQEDGILAIPLTWYSGWSDPAINSNLVPHGTPYCIEAMSLVEYMAGETGLEAPTVAVVSIPGDYGLDSAEGAVKAVEALGLELAYDGRGVVIPGDETSYDEAAAAIVDSGADIVFYTATPSAWSAVYGRAVAAGFQALWSGASPSWNPAFVAEDSAIKDAVTRDMYISGYYQAWDGDSAGAANVRDLMEAAGAPPTDYYGEGFVEAGIMYAALNKAYENGDMTQAGVLAAAKSLEGVSFDGLAPEETYVGEPNDIVQRAIWIRRPDGSALTGSTTIEEAYTSPVAAAYEFTEACYKLEG